MTLSGYFVLKLNDDDDDENAVVGQQGCRSLTFALA